MNIKVILIIVISIILFFFIKNKVLNRLNNSIFEPYFLWSKRYETVSTYNLLSTSYVSKHKTILNEIKKNNKVLWIRNNGKDINHVMKLLHFIKEPIIIITSDGDYSVPSDYINDIVNKLLSSPKILKWYTQNYDRSIIHPKLNYYPIGLDMHTKFTKTIYSTERLEKYNLYLKIRNQFKNRKINKIFCDTHLSSRHLDRTEMYKTLKDNKLIQFQDKRITHNEIINKYANYKYILSPRGHGIDCHRTWEIFLLGSIVITKTSSLDKMYIDNNLPVIILQSYNDLNNINFTQLDKWWEIHSEKCFDQNIMHKLVPSYWVKTN